MSLARKQKGWTLKVSSAGGSNILSMRSREGKQGLDTGIEWHLDGCRDLVFTRLARPLNNCVSNMDARIAMGPGRNWSMDVNADAGPLLVENQLLSEQPALFNSLKIKAKIAYDSQGPTFRADPFTLDINGSTLNLGLDVSLTSPPSVRVDMELPRTKAMDLLRSMPMAMRDKITGMRFAGTFAFKGGLFLDLDDLSKTRLTLKPDCSNLRLVSVPSKMSVETLSRDFIQVIRLDDQEIKRQVGPDSPDWCPLDSIPPYFIDCLLASEDVTFFQHKGFSVSAIRSALVDDLTQDQVVRGASTITQQLAKNLFLSKSKSLSRKLQEAILAWYLEANLTKQRILELYLNVIEWGPKIYGLRQASMHYFGKDPSDLDLAESGFLVAIIPSPVRWHQKILQVKGVPVAIDKKIKKILGVLRTRHVIDDDVVQEALEEPIEFNPETMAFTRKASTSPRPRK